MVVLRTPFFFEDDAAVVVVSSAVSPWCPMDVVRLHLLQESHGLVVVP